MRVTSIDRTIPQPLPEHPGNIFVEGEAFMVSVPAEVIGQSEHWRLKDIEGTVIAQGQVGRTNRLSLEPPAIGWYRIEFLRTNQTLAGWTTAAVLARLAASTPLDSPVCLDMAASWFARQNPSNQLIYANLAALAGANWVRDRLTWAEVQTGPDQFAPRGNYDQAAEIQKTQGLRVLQVFHSTPRWACGESGKTARFAADLRDLYRFAEAMGRRFEDRVLAWEPWNEPNVSSFGGHTMDEICSWQKAAWLGFRSSGAKTLVGWSALAAVPTWQQTRGVQLNEVWPYFDTYNIHTYDWAHAYADLWKSALEAAGGKPIWITEADRGALHDKTGPWYDLPPRAERLKAEYMGQSYAASLGAGAQRHFHFILGNYQEPNGVQFGLLRLDYTPRPAYVALAADGRFLAGARLLGRWQPAPDINVMAFRALPDGEVSDVLVVWTEREVDWEQRGKARAPMTWPPSLNPKAVYDFLGRQQGRNLPATIQSAPLFIILPPGQANTMPLVKPSISNTPPDPGEASQVVLQTLFPPAAHARIEDKP